jgi:hypothetical protein
MATFPPHHPLFKGIKLAHTNCSTHNFESTRKFPSPIHSLLKAFRTNPNRMEKILPVRHYTKWHPDVTTEIAEDSETALSADEHAQEDTHVYSDGSAIDDGVGAAAVLMGGGVEVEALRFHLGSVKNHTVYEGELVGMVLAVELLRKEAGRRDSMALGTDNQAAIRVTQAFNSKSGHYLMDIFHDDLRTIIPEFDQ